MKKFLSKIVSMINYNILTLLKFELIYKLFISFCLMPVLVYTFNIMMKITGYKYLTFYNVKSFLINPYTLLYGLFLLIILTILTLFDIISIIVIYDSSYHKKKISMVDTVRISLGKLKNILKLKNIPVSFLVLFLIPFLNIGVESNLISSIKLPEFIMDFIYGSKLYFSLYVLVYLFFLSILSKWLYSLHYMIIEDKSFIASCKCSKNMIKKNRIRDLLKLLCIQLLSTAFYFLVLFLGIIVIYFLHKVLNNHQIVQSVLITIIGLFSSIMLFIFLMISNSISYGVISYLFYKHKEEINEPIKSINYVEKKYNNNHLKYMFVGFIIILVIVGYIFTYKVVSGKYDLTTSYANVTEITAHRGDCSSALENSMEAFKSALLKGADWIELDVQLTLDGKVVVSHDNNLSRLAGVNKNISDLTFEELSNIEIGKTINKKYSGHKILLLQDVIDFAKDNNIRLNIELKPTKDNMNELALEVIDIIVENDFTSKCVISSLNYDILALVKKLYYEVKTVYVMSIAIGDFSDLEFIDIYSIEATNVTSKLVDKIHNAGKEVYVWTVSDEENINTIAHMNVDNIITDNLELCKSIINKGRNTNMINELINELEKIWR